MRPHSVSKWGRLRMCSHCDLRRGGGCLEMRPHPVSKWGRLRMCPHCDSRRGGGCRDAPTTSLGMRMGCKHQPPRRSFPARIIALGSSPPNPKPGLADSTSDGKTSDPTNHRWPRGHRDGRVERRHHDHDERRRRDLGEGRRHGRGKQRQHDLGERQHHGGGERRHHGLGERQHCGIASWVRPTQRFVGSTRRPKRLRAGSTHW
jgi:hypothetical protein